MRVLGIFSKTHDTGLAVVRNGIPELVLEEERFARIKHTTAFPANALKAAFGGGLVDIREVDAVAIPWKGGRLLGNFMKAIWARPPASFSLLHPEAHATHEIGIVNQWMRMHIQLRKHLGTMRLPPVHEVGHHDAHAASFFVSPFEEATVLVMDGYGDDSATSAYIGRGNRLERVWKLGFFDSLGMLYTCVTQHLGFKPFEEGTVMALAACGGPTYLDSFRKLVHLGENGSFNVDRAYASYPTYGLRRPFTDRFAETFGPARKPGEPLLDRHRDLAFALQAVTEETILHIVRHLERLNPSRNLVISGGVGLNCVANARILRDTSFERVWVPPCASDTGAPLGAALWHTHQTKGLPRTFEMTHAFFGKEYSEAEIEAALAAAGLGSKRLSDEELFPQVAQDLASQRIVGWYQGRFEIGPRALGNRSILADPRPLEIRDILNARIKYREPFRPFAPAVLLERASEFFEISQPDPFMTMAPRVRPEKTGVIPSAVHVDGTGRIETVRREDNPRFHRLISAFADLTGVPILINTSFNRHEPVVASPAEAISCYLRTEMDVLILGNHYVTDRSPDAQKRALQAFEIEAARRRRR